MVLILVMYLQSECIEKYQFELGKNMIEKHDFDVIHGLVVLCRKTRCIRRMHSHDVGRQIETSQIDAAIDVFLF